MIASSSASLVGLDIDGRVWIYDDNCDVETPLIHPNLGKIRVKYVSCGFAFTVCIEEHGKAWAFGHNAYGQLGCGNSEYQNEPVQVLNLPPVSSVHCGDNHTLFIDDNSNVWGVGRNNVGQLGLGFSEDIEFPQKSNLTQVIDISCGYRHSVAITKDGRIFSTGENLVGQLGLLDFSNVDIFTEIQAFSDHPIKVIACGSFFTVMLDSCGFVYGCGMYRYWDVVSEKENDSKFNFFVRLKVEDIQNIFCRFNSLILLDLDNDVIYFGQHDQYDFSKLHNVCYMAVGGSYYFAKDNLGGSWLLGTDLPKKTVHKSPKLVDSEKFCFGPINSHHRVKSARK